MSPDNIRKLMRKYGAAANKNCSEVPVNAHPHLWHHSRAMHLYQHGMDLTLIAQWLGHANLETSLIYAYADTEQKRKAIEKATASRSSLKEDKPIPMWDEDSDELLKKLYGLR